jgi:CheY-like chemotaxis protein
MSQKILVADDSLTIQKVIKITLLEKDYKLEMAETCDEVLEKLTSDSFGLVLLDFNLSSEMTGHEIANKIKDIAPRTPILAMIGSFDSVDEDKLHSSGISGKIVKPFESSKFINTVDELFVHSNDEEDRHDDKTSVTMLTDQGALEYQDEEDHDINDQWTMSSSSPESSHKEVETTKVAEAPSANFPKNVLKKEMLNWSQDGDDDSLELPDVISADGGDEGSLELPPVMGEEPEQERELELEPEKDQEREMVLDTSRSTLGTAVLDEPIQGAKEEFWANDEVVDTPSKTESPVQKSWPVDQQDISQAAGDDHIQLEDELKKELTPVVEKLVKKYCEERVEKIAWEIIPDLAENLIKKELRSLAQRASDS